MPTAAKLIGGLFLMVTAVLSSYLFLNDSDVLYATSEFYFVNAAIGFLVGWRWIGVDPGFGGLGSIVSGLRGTFLVMVLSATTFGLWVVFIKLERFYIKDFASIIVSWYDGLMDYFTLIIEPNVLFSMVIGGCISGIAAGFANRYWT